ncbi:MAG: class I SAM-dependent methyltransferase [Gemmataceae bacterium]|nr:class I SAM-dependent methyltransferase [Gemmataceae bacterium]
MLPRILEPEVMDTAEEARDYDGMDHSHVNQVFVTDFLKLGATTKAALDVGAGTAQIPIALCQAHPMIRVVAIDLANEMLAVGQRNVQRAGLAARIDLRFIDAKAMPFADTAFDAVISNSIVHHIPEPFAVFAEMARVVKNGGVLFVRDLLRPTTKAALDEFVRMYAGDANAHQQKMFSESLHAALTLDEVQDLVRRVGHDPASVKQTSDRHWTWATISLPSPNAAP